MIGNREIAVRCHQLGERPEPAREVVMLTDERSIRRVLRPGRLVRRIEGAEMEFEI